jgi:tetratricopeptide (TPR) repeat protein
MGVRIGGFLLIAYLGLFIIVFAFLTRQMSSVLKKRLIVQIIVVSVAGYLIAILFWPYAHQGIISMPLEALKIMSHFFVNIGLIFDGKRILSNQVPWYYIPKYILYTAPVIVLAGAAIGLGCIPVIFRKNKNQLIFALMVVFSCVFPIAYAIYQKSSLYDGWRHFLFIYPPLVVIAAIGWATLIRSRQKAVGYAMAGLLAVGLYSPVRFTLVNHPFESLYFNEIEGGIKNAYGKFETDYYMLGIKPATEWLMKNERLADKKATVVTNCIYPLQAYMYLSHYKNLPWKYDINYERFADFRHDSVYEAFGKEHPDFKDNFPSGCDYVRYGERYKKDWDYCILFSRFVDVSQLTTGNWPPPETIHTIDVDGVPVAAILKRKTKKDLEGFNLWKDKKYEEAKAAFLASLQEYPGNDLVWEKMAEIYSAENKPDSVLYACSKVLARDPGNVNIYEMAGQIYLKQGKTDSAIQLYKGLEKYDASYSHFFTAYAYAVKGNISAAYSEIDNAIDADASNQSAYKLGIQIAQQTKNKAKEEEYYDRARKEFPEEEGK